MVKKLVTCNFLNVCIMNSAWLIEYSFIPFCLRSLWWFLDWRSGPWYSSLPLLSSVPLTSLHFLQPRPEFQLSRGLSNVITPLSWRTEILLSWYFLDDGKGWPREFVIFVDPIFINPDTSIYRPVIKTEVKKVIILFKWKYNSIETHWSSSTDGLQLRESNTQISHLLVWEATLARKFAWDSQGRVSD